MLLLANLFHQFGQGGAHFELADHERVGRSDDVADRLTLRRTVSVESAPALTYPRQPIRHRGTKYATANIREGS
jgi:hypothetical protein